MQATTALPLTLRRQECDPQLVREWAAEDFAVSIGLLRECPYHGQPYKVSRSPLASKGLARSFANPIDPAVQAFNGDMQQLLAAAERVSHMYAERCALCESEQDGGD